MAILKIASIEPLVGLQEIISEIQNIRKSKTHADSDSQKTALEKENLLVSPAVTENSVANQQHLFSGVYGEKKPVADASVIKNILQSGKVVSSEESSLQSSETDPETNTLEKQDDSTEHKQFSRTNIEKTYAVGTVSFQYDAELIENVVRETTPEDQNSLVQKEVSENQHADQNIEQSVAEPPKEWCEFSTEVQKQSSKLASFIRNAIPQIMAGSQLKLSFKSGNYASMLTEENRESLEQIATAWTGHSVHVSCNNSPTVTSQLTIAEHEQILIEQEKELKRKKACEFPQVKDVLSVFTNSRITRIELHNA